MKLLVCMSQVPDTTTKIKFIEQNKQLDSAAIQWIINPWDELSLTRALELKDDPVKEIELVTVVHVGTVTSEPTIRKALAIGADDAIRINAEPSDACFVAVQLAEVLRNHPCDVILCGIESSDYNGASVGGMLAECLGIQSVSGVSALQIENGRVLMTREIDGGKELVSTPTPVVAIVQKGIAKEPRIPSMRGIMTARTKPIKVVEPVAFETMTGILAFELPPPRAACKFVDPENPKLLVELLQNEAKLI